MKNLFTVFLVLLVFQITLRSQVAGDYGSAATGTWSSVGSWLVFNTAADWSDATAAPGLPTASTNVYIRAGHTITLDIAGMTCKNLTIAGTTTFKTTTTPASSNVGYDITVNGDLTVNSTGTFRVTANTNGIASPNGGIANSLILYGNLSNSAGGVCNFRTGSSGSTLSVCNVSMVGANNVTMTDPYVSTTNGTFNYITINKTSPGKVTLGSNIITSGGSSTGPTSCNSGITFTNGIVETGNYFIAYQGTTNAQCVGGTSASYVKGYFARGMSSSAATSKDFFVGDDNGYRPVQVHATTSGGATGHLIVVRCIPGNANTGSSTLNGGIDKVSNVRYYQVKYDATIAGNASMTIDYAKLPLGADDGVTVGSTDLRVAYSTNNGSTWNGLGQTATYTVATPTDPPAQITPDPMASPYVLNSLSSMYFALANATGGSNPLPVELSSFTANSKDNAVNLHWTTATEIENSGFDVERAQVLSGSKNWTKIGFVKGSGASNTPKEYSFSDANIQGNGTYLYRLKQIDNNGQFIYSSEISVSVAFAPKTYTLDQNYPNPFNPSTSIRFGLPVDSHVQVRVYNSIGQQVALLTNDVMSAGYQTINWNAASLSSGLYYYSVEAKSLDGKSTFTATKKMMLLK